MSNLPAEGSTPALPYSRPLILLAGALLGALAATGCAGSGSAPGESNGETDAAQQAGGDHYARRVSPFPVQGAGGEAYDHPFLGGFNIPRPQVVDVNGDGAQDLFIQEETNRLIFFENTAPPDAPAELVWRSSKYRGLDVGEWYRFADLTGAPTPDLLAEQPYSYLRYYRNRAGGQSGKARFELAKDTLRTVGGELLFSDRQNIPNVADVDCDARPDLFVGRLDGTITRYEATRKTKGNATSEEGLPRFRLVTEKFAGIEIVGQGPRPGRTPPRPGQNDPLGGSGGNGPHPPTTDHQPPTTETPKHGANTMAFADADGDGDPDLLWGDYFEKGLLMLENRGGCEALNFSSDPQAFPPQDPMTSSGYNAPAIGDLTGDGQPDMLVGVIGGAYNPQRTTAANLYFYERREGGAYEKRSERFLSMIDVGVESAPAFGDLDGDDDLDLLIGNKAAAKTGGGGQVLRYENTGTPGTPRLRLADTLALAPAGAYNRAPALADLDDDGDLDLVTGTWRKGLFWHENTGSATSAQFAEEGESLLAARKNISHAAPAFADLDDDDDLDLVVGGSAGGLKVFRNEGSARQPQFAPAPDLLDGVTVDRRSVPALRDTDGDGAPDLLVGSETDGLTFFRNEGSPRQAQFARVGSGEGSPFPMYAPGLAAPAFADMDADGDADLFTGAGRGGLFFFEDRR
jgi:hypothetical protein